MALQIRVLVSKTIYSVALRDTAMLLVKILFLGCPFVNTVLQR